MATTEIPPARPAELHDVPVLVVQLQDDLARSRLREAFWISVVVHLLAFIAIWSSPRWLDKSKTISVRTADELIRGKQLTYLDLPHDMQKVEKAPETNIISDKNRIATSKRPTLDRKLLDQLRNPGNPGAPGVPGPPIPQGPVPRPQVAQSQPATQAGPSGAPAPPVQSQPQNQNMASLNTPAAKPNLFGRQSAGASLNEAARAAATSRTSGHGGSLGNYGAGPGASRGVRDNLEVLSDTMGVDFGPYLSRVLHDVRVNWYTLIPEVARAPMMRKGKVSIEFAILKDGKVAGLRLMQPSGDVSLDRAAWGGITASNPFPPLPGEFRGNYLALRFHFLYNPDKNDLQ